MDELRQAENLRQGTHSVNMDFRYTTTNHRTYFALTKTLKRAKYRRCVLVDDVAERLKQLLTEKARTIEVELRDIAILPDHVPQSPLRDSATTYYAHRSIV